VKLQVAVIGCGNVSAVHFPPIVESKAAELVAVCDIKPKRAQAAADKHRVPWFSHYERVLELKPDLVHICTPHHTHAEIAVAAAERGIHVLTEKPMAINLADADRMIRTARKTKVKLGVIFQNRYNPASQAVYEAVQEGALGELLGCRLFVTWCRLQHYYSQSDWKGTWSEEGGGALINQAIHTIDLMQWIMGDVASLQGSVANRAHPEIEVEDVAEARILFKNGAVGSLYVCNYYTYDADCFLEIHGTEGVARLEKERAIIRVKGRPERIIACEGAPGLGKPSWGASHKTQIEQFHRSVLNGSQVEIDGASGRKALEIVRAIYYSSSLKGESIPFPFQEPAGFNPPPLG